jgi:hypothetical protein
MPPESCPANSGTLSGIGRNPVRIKSESVSEWRRNTQVTAAAAPAWLLVHSEAWKTQRFSRLRHASSYQICAKEKLKKRSN